MKLTFTCTHVLEMARLHHVVFTLAGLYYGDGTPQGSWRGTRRAGWYAYDNGSGDRLVVAWSAGVVVGLVFDHESERNEFDEDEDDRTPLAHLRGITGRARALATKTAADFENLVTAGFWSVGDAVKLSDPIGEHGLDLIAGFGLPPGEAVFGRALRQSWRELASLPEPHARVAIRIADAGKLAAADRATLLELPDGVATIDLAAAQAVKRSLADLGIAWSVPVARIRELAAAKQRDDELRVTTALVPDDRALLEAARVNAVAAIAELLARGANVDARTVEGQWQYTPAGDTPLIQACKAGAREAARALLDSGADPNARNRFEQTALLWAARASWRDVVASCLAAGGDPNLADTSNEAPLLFAAQAGDVEMVELLVASGAQVDRKTRSGVTAGERAGMHGHHTLAARLRTFSS